MHTPEYRRWNRERDRLENVAYPRAAWSQVKQQVARACDPSDGWSDPQFAAELLARWIAGERFDAHRAARPIEPDPVLAGDAGELLADPDERRRCVEVLARGGKHYQGPGARAVIVEAIGRLKARADRRSCRGIAEAIRQAKPGRIVELAKKRRREREAAALARWQERVKTGKLGLSTVRATFRRPEIAQRFLGGKGDLVDGAVRLVVRAIGTIGDQVERDLAAMGTYENFDGKKGRNHKLEGVELERLQIRADWTAALITLRHYCSYGSSRFGSGDRSYGSVGGSNCLTYLAVRDATTGEAHLLRLPPKYGDSRTQFFGRFGSEVERIQAAVAWTFAREPREYAPAIET